MVKQLTEIGKKSFLFLVILFACPTYAATYHVSPGGSNSNDGSSEILAWKRIQYAARKVSAGDTVLVHKGDYQRENVILKRSGTETAPIRFRAAPGEAPLVGSFMLRNAHWIELKGFTFRGPKEFPANWTNLPEVVIDDPSVGYIDPREAWSTRKAKVEKKFKTYMSLKRHMERPYVTGIHAREGSSNIIISGNTISHHTIGIAMKEGASSIIIEDNTIHHCRNGIWTFNNSGGTSASDIVIRNNNFSQNVMDGIEIRSSARRVVIVDNKFEHNGIKHIGFKQSSRDGVIRNNQMQSAGYYAESLKHPGSSAISLHSLEPSANVLVENNYQAYQLEPTWDSNGLIVDLSANTGAIVRFNLFYRNMGAGITFTKSPLVYAYNNSNVENGYRAPGVLAPLNGPGLRLTRPKDVNNRIINNIQYKNRIAGFYSGGQLEQQKRLDYNLYYPAKGAAALRDSNTKSKIFRTVKDVRDKTGAEEYGLDADPMFVNPGNGDFQLSPGSPAIDAGGFLTHTVGEGSGQTIRVIDAGYFFPGFGKVSGDLIVVGSGEPVRITGIDIGNNTITVDKSLSWVDGDPVSLPYSGQAPDIGFAEFSENDTATLVR